MSKQALSERKVALCYIRLSVTKETSDLTSPERQRANIEAACRKYDWTPEWYEDAKGHKSATKEENRPAWQELKTRLKDADVAALVVNEQSRAMRNAWRAIKLFEELPAYGVVLHLAALDRTIDITTPDGRMSAYIQAFLDDLYALDARRRSLDSVKYRKGKNITIVSHRLAQFAARMGCSSRRHMAHGSCQTAHSKRGKTNFSRLTLMQSGVDTTNVLNSS